MEKRAFLPLQCNFSQLVLANLVAISRFPLQQRVKHEAHQTASPWRAALCSGVKSALLLPGLRKYSVGSSDPAIPRWEPLLFIERKVDLTFIRWCSPKLLCLGDTALSGRTSPGCASLISAPFVVAVQGCLNKQHLESDLSSSLLIIYWF